MDVHMSRLVGPLGRGLSTLLIAGGLVLGLAPASASAAAPDARLAPLPGVARPATRTLTCSGTPEEPGVLAGRYDGNVSIEGLCDVNAGRAVVTGNLTLRPGSALLAAFALNDQTGSGESSLTVHGDVHVQEGATMLAGCDFQSFPCLDDPEPEHPTLSSRDRIYGNLVEQQPLGVVIHNSIIFGNVSENGGGGGLTCEPSGFFALFGSPVYSDYERSIIKGSLEVTGVTSCWLGVIEEHVSGNVRVNEDQLADPDAIEILSNKIRGNLNCQGDSNTWDTEDLTEELYPRTPKPNKVDGLRRGQCVLASPTEEGVPPVPGPF